MKAINALIASVLLFCSTVLPAEAQLYWVAQSGAWDNPANWASCEGCQGGAAIPNEHSDVVFTSTTAVLVNQAAHCRNITVNNDAALNLSGTASLTVSGAAVFTQNSSIQPSELIFSGSETSILAACAINCDLTATAGTILELNSGLDLTGAKIVVSQSVEVHPAVQAVETEATIWPNENTDVNAGPLTIAWNRSSTCGTGPGQTEFTITAFVASDYNGQDISCNGADDGVASVNVVGGIGPFAFQWVGGPSPVFTQNCSGLGAGTYTVLVTDLGQGVTCVDNVQLTEPAPLTVFSMMSTPPTCSGVCNGSATPITIGGVSPYTYAWGNGETTMTATALCEGITTLVISDLNSCEFITQVEQVVNETEPNLSTTDVLCNGGATGSASVAPSGGSGGPYTILWSTGANGIEITGLSAGNYSVDVTDTNDCTVSVDFTISEEPPIQPSIDNVINLLCAGEATGEISASATGGTPPYDFEWNGPNAFTGNGEIIGGLLDGTYTLTVTDVNDCVGSTQATVSAPAEIELSASIQDVNCNGDATGSIDLTATGGTGALTYQWSGPNGFASSSQDIGGLTAGSYTVTVTDVNDCQETATYDVIEPDELEATADLTDVSCNGLADGSITLTPQGGTPAYTATWSGPAGYSNTGFSISNLAEGSYQVTLSDAFDCEVIITYDIVQPDPIDIAIDIDPITCNGNDDATITANVSGGSEPYTYFWTGPHGTSSDPVINNAEVGAYNLTVTDDNGCQMMATALVSEPDPLVLVPNITSPSCGGDADGAIDLTILGGTPPYTVSWTGPDGFTSNQQSISGLTAGFYEVDITDLAGCQTNSAYTVTEIPAIVLDVTATDISCNGLSDGSIVLNISGGQGPYDISWAGPNLFTSNSQNLSGLEAGTYNVLVVDANDCFEESFAIIVEPDPIAFDVVIVEPSCFGENDGSIELVISGGQAPYSVNWNTGGSGELIDNLPAGSYSAFILDDAGCSISSGNITLDQDDEIIIDLNSVNPSCFGDANGSIEATVTGGVAPYEITWSGPNGFTSNQLTLSSLEPGSYELQVEDAEGCESSATVLIEAPDEIAVDQSNTNAVCADDLIDVSISISGGTAPYQVVWSGPGGFASTDENLTNVNQGDYFLDLMDANGCTFQALYSITALDPLLVSGSVTPLDCTGDPIGAIELEITGGQPPFTVNWTATNGFNSFDQDIFNLEEGLYTVVVTDDLGCVINTAFNLSQPDALIADIATTEPSCAGDADGAISVSISGGESPYTYSWSGPNGFTSNQNTLSGLIAGTYSLEVNDSGSCSETFEVVLSEPDQITLAADVTNILCGGSETGAIDLTVSGGTAPFGFVWSSPGFTASTEDIADLPAASYQVDIIDANGCTSDTIVVVLEETPIDADLLTTNSTCNESNGSAEATVSGGNGTLDLVWLSEGNPIGTGNQVSDLTAGSYTLQVTDEFDCVSTFDFSITDSDAVDLDAVLTNPLCHGDSTGTIALTTDGGTGTLIFDWSGPNGFTSSSQNISDLFEGSYTVEVTDELGCFNALTVELTAPEALQIAIDVTNVSCNATDDGAISVTTNGGTSPYTYAWTGPDGFTSDQSDLSDLLPGTYNLTVTDAQMCEQTAMVEVQQTTTIDLDFNITNVTCNGENDGEIELLILSGTPPYTIEWSGPSGFSSSSQDIINLFAGDYTLNISDAAGCDLETTVTVDENEGIFIGINATAPTCLSSDGELEVVITGGSGTYNVFWYDLSNGNVLIGTDPVVSDLPAGSYFVEVFDDLGCEVSQSTSLSDAPGDLFADLFHVSCNGAADGSILLSIDGATPPFNYSWTGPDGFTDNNQDIDALEPGTYTIQVTDALGCTIIESFDLNEPAELVAQLSATDVLCNGDNNGTILTSVLGGTPPYNLSWTGPNGFTSTTDNLSDLTAGCYDLTVIDANACEASASVCIDEPDALDIETIPTSIACSGDSTGSIELIITGGTGTYGISWSGPNGFTSSDQDIFNLLAGEYIASITDNGNCAVEISVEVTENPAVQAEADLTLPSCPGEDDGAIALDITGGLAPYNVTWLDADSLEIGTGFDLNDLPAGTYIFIIEDAFSCSVEGEFELPEPEVLEVDAEVFNVTCAGLNDGEIIVEISGGNLPYSTFWTGPNGFTSTAESLTGLAPGSYELTYGDASACSAQATFVIEPATPIQIVFEDISAASCLSISDGSISISVSGGTTPYTFEWTADNGFESNEQDIDSLATGIYSLVVSDENGCSETIDVVQLGYLGDVSANAGADQEFCFGSVLELEGSNTGATSSYWADEDGEVLVTGDFYSSTPNAGTHVFIYVAVDAGCTDRDTLEVVVYELPFLNPGSNRNIYPDEQTTLGGNPTADSDLLITWSPTELLLDDDVLNPVTQPLNVSTWFFAEVIDFNGCSARDSVLVEVIPEIDVPSGFTPNGDGMNDVWNIANAGLYPSMTVEIYNRWGEMLYRADRGYTRPWDGTFNGNPLPIGTYYYVIEIRESNFEANVNGPVTILR